MKKSIIVHKNKVTEIRIVRPMMGKNIRDHIKTI